MSPRATRKPNLLQVDPGREFMGVVNQLLAKHNVQVRRGRVGSHREQGIVERFNRTLAERLFGAQYAQELLLAARKSSERSAEWGRALPEVVAAVNGEETRLLGKKLNDAIKDTSLCILRRCQLTVLLASKNPCFHPRRLWLFVCAG